MEIGALEAVVRSARVTVDDCVIHAPRGGIVERLYYDPGELLPAGAIALRIVSRAELKAVVYLSNADFDVARLGETVSLEADAVPGRFFEAEIVRLGVEAEFTPRNVQTRSDRDRLVFPVEVRLRAPDSPLHAGMPVTVHFGGEGA